MKIGGFGRIEDFFYAEIILRQIYPFTQIQPKLFQFPLHRLESYEPIRELVSKLTIKDPDKRQESFGGNYENIKREALLVNCSWSKILSKTLPAPFYPQLGGPEDTRYFDDIEDIPLNYSFEESLTDFDSLFGSTITPISYSANLKL